MNTPDTNGQDTANGHVVVRELDRAVRRLGLSGTPVLVAVSAGIDSVVLASALARNAGLWGLEVRIGHVHHGLRGSEADADQAAVASLAECLEVPFAARRVDPRARRAGRSSRDRPTLQEAARDLRYGALREIAEALEAPVIATAHNADDQAETVLLRLLRGTGPDGLAGIPERSPDGWVARPLLRVSRAEIEAWARANAVAWREDPSNADPVYARSRLRRDWLPGLAEAFNPRLLRAIADLAEAQQRDSEWIDAAVTRELRARFSIEGSWLHIDTRDWAEIPEALTRRLARAALVACGAGRHVERVHLERIVAFLGTARTGSRLELPGGLTLLRDRGHDRLGPLRDDALGAPWTRKPAC